MNGTECKLSNIFYYLLYRMDEPVFFLQVIGSDLLRVIKMVYLRCTQHKIKPIVAIVLRLKYS